MIFSGAVPVFLVTMSSICAHWASVSVSALTTTSTPVSLMLTTTSSNPFASSRIRRRNINSAKEITASLAGSKLYSFGSLLSGSANETFSLELARAQVEQNFILIRQNEEIIRLLKKIAEQ